MSVNETEFVQAEQYLSVLGPRVFLEEREAELPFLCAGMPPEKQLVSAIDPRGVVGQRLQPFRQQPRFLRQETAVHEKQALQRYVGLRPPFAGGIRIGKVE